MWLLFVVAIVVGLGVLAVEIGVFLLEIANINDVLGVGRVTTFIRVFGKTEFASASLLPTFP